MSDDNAVVVEYRREGDDGHHLLTGSSALGELHIDYSGVPLSEQAGTATRLLATSALYCFASTFGTLLKARGATVQSLTGRAVIDKGRDQDQRMTVKAIKIELDVEVSEGDKPILEKCRRIMEQGCLVTYSLEGGIEMDHVIRSRP